MNIATMSNIIKRYGNHIVLDHVNIEIRQGEILGLLGPNGAGKTTVIHALSGLIGIDSGNIELFGERQSGSMLEAKRNIDWSRKTLPYLKILPRKKISRFSVGFMG